MTFVTEPHHKQDYFNFWSWFAGEFISGSSRFDCIFFSNKMKIDEAIGKVMSEKADANEILVCVRTIKNTIIGSKSKKQQLAKMGVLKKYKHTNYNCDQTVKIFFQKNRVLMLLNQETDTAILEQLVIVIGSFGNTTGVGTFKKKKKTQSRPHLTIKIFYFFQYVPSQSNNYSTIK